MSAEDLEPLSSHKSLVPYYKTSIVPPDVRSRIKREAFTIEAKIASNIDDLQTKKYMAFAAVGFAFLVISISFHVILGFIVAGIMIFFGQVYLFPEKQKTFDQEQANFARSVSQTDFHCPHCSHSFNAAAAWHCGNCGGLHEQTKENSFRYSSPFIQCLSVGCSKRDPVAIQCPNRDCSRHILLDHQNYLANQSYNTPYLGVARFKGDNNQPQVPENFSTSAFTDIFS